MAYDDLRDLNLAGVQWEITELSSVAMANAARDAAQSATTTVQTAQGVAQIVPDGTKSASPVAPVAPMGIDMAASMAARPTDIGALCRMIAEFNHPLRALSRGAVSPNVAEHPNGLMIITDVPGADDEDAGHILAGAAGELLDKMLGAIGMGRDVVSIFPLLFWRTPGGRSPSRMELDLARPFVNRAIELLSPRVILTLGTLAASEIGNANLPRDHGAVITPECGPIIVPIYHPNFLLLKPAAKRDAWTALQQVQNLLKTDNK